jgi:hypothetical protein
MRFAWGTPIENHWQDHSSNKLRFVQKGQTLVKRRSGKRPDLGGDCQWRLVYEQTSCGNYRFTLLKARQGNSLSIGNNKFWVIRAIQGLDKQVTDGLGELRSLNLLVMKRIKVTKRGDFGTQALVRENGTFSTNFIVMVRFTFLWLYSHFWPWPPLI